MLKSLLGAAAALSMLGVVACSQGPNEEAGENTDTAAEQATTGTTDLGQGPAEEAGESLDAQTGGTPAGETTTPPPATTTP
ncbi:MAG: hypothetical protein JNL81_01610 [Hyphomonadaceae bacterium]|nr:hypothetical protein [Hyphomonadaceae bacterium]